MDIQAQPMLIYCLKVYHFATCLFLMVNKQNVFHPEVSPYGL